MLRDQDYCKRNRKDETVHTNDTKQNWVKNNTRLYQKSTQNTK